VAGAKERRGEGHARRAAPAGKGAARIKQRAKDAAGHAPGSAGGWGRRHGIGMESGEGSIFFTCGRDKIRLVILEK
jgi:hypothetical protein